MTNRPPSHLREQERYEHGSVCRAFAGCKCEPCREARRAYDRRRDAAIRSGEWDSLVAAAPARRHLRKLSSRGVGIRSVAAACDLSFDRLGRIMRGEALRARKSTVERILAVDEGAMSDGGNVPAAPVYVLVHEMRAAGVTREELAERLGVAKWQLHTRYRYVKARTAMRIRKIHAEVLREVAEGEALAGFCASCGLDHGAQARLVRLSRMLPCSAADVREAYPCVYPPGMNTPGERMLFRDLHALGAESNGGLWMVNAKRRAA